MEVIKINDHAYTLHCMESMENETILFSASSSTTKCTSAAMIFHFIFINSIVHGIVPSAFWRNTVGSSIHLQAIKGKFHIIQTQSLPPALNRSSCNCTILFHYRIPAQIVNKQMSIIENMRICSANWHTITPCTEVQYPFCNKQS